MTHHLNPFFFLICIFHYQAFLSFHHTRLTNPILGSIRPSIFFCTWTSGETQIPCRLVSYTARASSLRWELDCPQLSFTNAMIALSSIPLNSSFSAVFNPHPPPWDYLSSPSEEMTPPFNSPHSAPALIVGRSALRALKFPRKCWLPLLTVNGLQLLSPICFLQGLSLSITSSVSRISSHFSFILSFL